jgi:hypothetical protein
MVAVTDDGFELLTPWPNGTGTLSKFNMHKKKLIIINFFNVGFHLWISVSCSTK